MPALKSDPKNYRVAVYARYSSDLQNASSIDDQLRICSALVEWQGWQVMGKYADRAVSGASMLRPQLQKLLADSRAGTFDVVVAEALDRLSRDQEDIAGLFKRLQFEGVRLVTCSEGDISELHVGLTHIREDPNVVKRMASHGYTAGQSISPVAA